MGLPDEEKKLQEVLKHDDFLQVSSARISEP
jgi:hypothetical protein